LKLIFNLSQSSVLSSATCVGVVNIFAPIASHRYSVLVLGMCFFAGGIKFSEQGFGASVFSYNTSFNPVPH
jgi:Ca2+/H+ antiporter